MEARLKAMLAALRQPGSNRIMLVTAGALVVALIAVPLLLGRSTPAPPPADLASKGASGTVDAPEAQVAVLAAEAYLRDYRERLDAFKQRNPFKQQLAFPDESEEEQIAEDAGSTASSATSSSSSSSSESNSGTAQVDADVDADADVEVDADAEVEVEERLLSFRLDVLAGPVGGTREIEDVTPLQFLPTTKKPIVEFIGADIDARKATFVVSGNVSATRGDGRCLPGDSDCDFLVLRVGEAQRLDYEVDGRTYRIKVLDIRRVVEDTGIVIETDTSGDSKRG